MCSVTTYIQFPYIYVDWRTRIINGGRRRVKMSYVKE